GLNKKDVEKLLSSWHLLPGQLRDDANALKDYSARSNKYLDGLAHARTIDFTAVYNELSKTGGPLRGFGGATGGYVTGPGGPKADKVGPTWLSNGEYIVNAASTAKHLPLIQAINADRLPGMAEGGAIGSITQHDFSTSAPSYLRWAADINAALDGIGKQIARTIASAIPGGSGVARWANVALAALSAAGQAASWLPRLLMQMRSESGGNPNAINLTDSNARAGHPSQGLMQTIPSTFNAYAGPYRGLGIDNPFANIYAAIEYTVSRYGSLSAWQGHGYDNGGLATGIGAMMKNTLAPERVLSPAQTASFDRLVSVLDSGAAGARPIEMNVYGHTGQSPTQIASEMKRQLTFEMR
ncbi:MAG: transglycosylase SLT domain-containing protein, partial [Sciscionella sp.]